MGSVLLSKVTALSKKCHRASVPSLLHPARAQCPKPLSVPKRFSVETWRCWAAAGGGGGGFPLRWPSLATVSEWRRSLSESILKSHGGGLNCFQVQHI